MAASGALIGAAVLLPSGCSSSSASGCRSVSVAVATPRITDIATAFDIDATVTASGHPLSGVSVEFWAWGAPPGEASSVGADLGAAVTGTDGRATLHEPPLVAGQAVTRLAANLTGNNLIRVSGDVAAGTSAGRAYCEAKGRAPVTDCGPGGCVIKEKP